MNFVKCINQINDVSGIKGLECVPRSSVNPSGSDKELYIPLVSIASQVEMTLEQVKAICNSDLTLQTSIGYVSFDTDQSNILAVPVSEIPNLFQRLRVQAEDETLVLSTYHKILNLKEKMYYV